MKDSFLRSKSLLSSFRWYPELFVTTKFAIARAVGFAFLTAYLFVAALSYYSTLQPPNLGLTIGQCNGVPCVIDVLPGGLAWDEGIRPGMAVSKIGEDEASSGRTDLNGATSVTINPDQGDPIEVALDQTAFIQLPMKLTLWTLGAVFALLGTAVILRRPDLRAAQLFGVFAGVTSLALTVGPSSTGPGPDWAVIMQVITLLSLAPLCFVFVVSLVGYRAEFFDSFIRPTVIGIYSLILLGFILSMLVDPELYAYVRPSMLLYTSILLLASIGFLAFASKQQKPPLFSQQSRIALAGIAFGTSPFIFLTLIPEGFHIGSLIPIHFTVLPIGLMPVFFAYAILHHQLLGIRRLIHRGMVYVGTSIILLTITSIVLSAIFSWLSDSSLESSSIPLMSGIILLGVILFYPLRAAGHRLADRLIYGDVPDYTTIIDAVRSDLLSPGQTKEVAASMANMLVNLLDLESILIYLGDNPKDATLFAAQGHRTDEARKIFFPSLSSEIERSIDEDLIEAKWQSDSLLLASLALPGTYFGYMVIGPKRGGEIFLPQEKELITNMTPVLSLSIDKSIQSQRLRELNRELMKAGEKERGNIAADIHDGPLQKAILLAGVGNGKIDDPIAVAKELAFELREICSRLRPAILDHLGAVPAIEWLLDETKKRHKISTELSLFNLEEDERLSPDEELVVFRVAQEAINNTVKHAMADSLMVLLEKENDTLVLEVSDDGKGFTDQAKSNGDGGFGLTGMHERVVQINGSLEVRSAAGIGTTITARIPLEMDSKG